MKRSIIILLLLLSFHIFPEEVVTLKNGKKVILFDDHTWAEYNAGNSSSEDLISKYSKHLRKGIPANNEQIKTACEMYEQGWRYKMPVPKSSKAAWGVTDGRTTWYYGYWYNIVNKEYSHTTPIISQSGIYTGDKQNNSHSWRKGGSPRKPDIYMYLLSEYGGPKF